MNNVILYALWGGLYLLCAALGLFAVPPAVGILFCLLFFVPPAILLYQARDAKCVRLVRNLAVGWLAVTVVLLILNILSVMMTALTGTVLYYMLVVLTAPMVCGQYWLIALFCWACLLVVSLQRLKNMKK